MKKYHFKNNLIANNSCSTEDQLLQFYLSAVKKEPKPEDMSLSLYLTCMALQIFEQFGNKFPTQEEIDVIEKAFKRYSRRKTSISQVIMVAA